MSNKRKYNEPIVSEKLKTIEDFKNGMSVRTVALKYISVYTVSNLKNQREKFIERVLRNESILRKRVSRLCGKPSILDERVYNWFAAARCHYIHISGPLIQEKGKNVAEYWNLKISKLQMDGWTHSVGETIYLSWRNCSH